MTKQKVMSSTYNKIVSAIFTYKCARNQNLGFRDAKSVKN